MTNTPAERSTEPRVEGGIAPAYSSADYTSVESPGSDVPGVGYSSFQPGDTAGDGEKSTTDVAKGEAAAVKDTAAEAGQNVADTAKSEAVNVAEETKAQAKGLLDSVTSQVQEQAGTQQRRLADTVQGLAGELESMASGSQDSDSQGPLTDLARQGADKGHEIAGWLQDKEPRDVLEQVQSFARRRPVLFLVLCGAAGVVAGRLTRGAIGANTSLDTPGDSDSGDRGRDVTGPTGGRELSAGSAAPLLDEPALGEHAMPAGGAPGHYQTSGYVAEEYPSQVPATGVAGTGGLAAGSVGVPTTGTDPMPGAGQR